MPKTLFRPQIDGSRFDFTDAIDKKEFDGVRRKIESAVDDAIDFLKPFYSVALEVYDIRNNLVDSVANKIPPNYIRHSGIIYITLDYYNTRRFYPRFDSKKEKSSTVISSFFRRRTSDSIQANAALLLSNTAIAYMIPDRWLPESWLVDPIKEEIKQMEIIKESTIDLTLRIPPGGNLWLRYKCKEEWDKLKKYLDSGKPWPIRLIGASLSPYENESVIAYGYREPSDGTGQIYVYDLNCPGQEQALNLRFHGKPHITVEGFDNSPVDNIRGFYCENYLQEPTPSIGRFLFLLKIFPVKPIWYVTRWMRLFWLWIRSLIPN